MIHPDDLPEEVRAALIARITPEMQEKQDAARERLRSNIERLSREQITREEATGTTAMDMLRAAADVEVGGHDCPCATGYGLACAGCDVAADVEIHTGSPSGGPEPLEGE